VQRFDVRNQRFNLVEILRRAFQRDTPRKAVEQVDMRIDDQFEKTLRPHLTGSILCLFPASEERWKQIQFLDANSLSAQPAGGYAEHEHCRSARDQNALFHG
jgi:hypothetical protein